MPVQRVTGVRMPLQSFSSAAGMKRPCMLDGPRVTGTTETPHDLSRPLRRLFTWSACEEQTAYARCAASAACADLTSAPKAA